MGKMAGTSRWGSSVANMHASNQKKQREKTFHLEIALIMAPTKPFGAF